MYYYVTYHNKHRSRCGIAMSLHSCTTLTLMGVLHYEDKQTTSVHSRTIDITHTPHATTSVSYYDQRETSPLLSSVFSFFI